MARYDPDKHQRRSIRLQGYDYTLPGAYFVTIVTHGRELLFEDTVLHRVVETYWQRIPGHTLHVELDEWVVMSNHLHGIIVITNPIVGATHSPRNPPMKRFHGPATGFQSEKDQHGNASPLPSTGPSPRNPSTKRPHGPATILQSEQDQHGNASPLPSTGPSPLNPSTERPHGPATILQSERDQHWNASPLPPTGLSPGSLGAIIGNFKSVTTRRINRVRHSPGLRVWQRNYYERIIRNERELNAIRQYIHDNPARWDADEENPARIQVT